MSLRKTISQLRLYPKSQISALALLLEKIVKIFHIRFKAIILYRLRHMRGLRYKAFQDQERTGIEDGMMRLRKPYGTYKDFGTSFCDVRGMYSSIIPSNIGRRQMTDRKKTRRPAKHCSRSRKDNIPQRSIQPFEMSLWGRKYYLFCLI